MSALRAVLIASLVAAWLAVPLLAVPTAAIDGPVQPSIQPTFQTVANGNNTSQTTVGQQISGFMQQQTSQAKGAVESGMWTAAFQNASGESQKAALVNQRTEGLGNEVAALQAQRQSLIEARESGEISALEFRSQMSGLVGRYASLLAAINETEPRAKAVGVNATAIEDLRGAATAAVGPEVAAAAGSAVVVSPPGLANTTAGPPADVPGQGNGTGVANGSVGNGTLGEGVGNGNGAGNGNGNGNGVGNDDGGGIDIGDGIGVDTGDAFNYTDPLGSNDLALDGSLVE